jgi:methionine biosynthesis protein MetW
MTNGKMSQKLISSLIKNDAKVLDVGCGNGSLLIFLENEKKINGHGLEISHQGVQECLAKGLSVLQGNADTDLTNFPENSFDYVILSRTLQATHKPKEVLKQMLRIGKSCIVSFPNFAHWKCRLDLLLKGEMPMTKTLSEPWYQTPNIHLCTIKDFIKICNSLNISIDKAFRISESGSIKSIKKAESFYNNLFSVEGIFVISQKI